MARGINSALKFTQSDFVSAMQSKLDLISKNASFSEDVWEFEYFCNSRLKQIPVLIDFSIFDNEKLFPIIKGSLGNNLLFSEQYSLKYIAKCALLETLNTSNAKAIKTTLNALIRCFGYLYQRHSLGHDINHDGLFKFLMTMGLDRNGFFEKIKPFSYQTAIAYLDFNTLNDVIIQLKLSIQLGFISENEIRKKLNKICTSLLDITYDEYREGGTLNSLTLDCGMHYFSYLQSTVDRYIAPATSIKLLADSYEQFLNESRIKHRNKLQQQYIKMVSGVSVDDCIEAVVAANKIVIQEKSHWPITLKTAHDWIVKKYQGTCIPLTIRYRMMQDVYLENLVNRLGFQQNIATIHALKTIVFVHLFQDENLKDAPSASDLYDEVFPILSRPDNSDFKFFTKQLDALMQTTMVMTDHPSSPEQLYRECPLRLENKSSPKCDMFVRKIQAAIKTLVTAMAGWRASEFGFSLNDITISRNLDALDNSIHPLSFKVKWIVPKTNGTTKLNREITVGIYHLLTQIKTLLNVKSNYKILTDNSGTISGESIKFNWIDFYYNYKPFKFLRSIQNKSLEEKKVEWIKSEYASQYKLEQVYETEAKIKQSCLMSEALFIESGSDNLRPSKLFQSYLNNSLPSDIQSTWERVIPDDLKNFSQNLDNMTSEEKRELSNYIYHLFTDDIVLPTPHALRHCWAEAIYRRYSGDVGWFIRSNFKHLSNSFFMRYLRDKHMKEISERAKRDFLSHLVTRHISGQSDESREFSGRLDAYLTRIGKNIKVLPIDQIREFVDEFVENEIIDLKVNSWGFCILRRRATSNAKCAESGVPRRENAGVDLCIGCSNNLSEMPHIEGIMLSISNHVNVITETELPYQFKAKSLQVVKKALSHINMMKKNSGSNQLDVYIAYIKDAIKISQKDIIDAQYI